MDRVFVFLSCLAAFLVLCQWFAFAWMRRYLFQRYEPVSRKVAYSVLFFIAALNLVALRFSFEAEGGLDLSLAHRVASIAYFSFLGAVLMVSLLFLLVGIAWVVVRASDLLVQWIGLPNRKPRLLSSDQRGFFARWTRERVPGTRDSDREEPEAEEPPINAPSRREFLKWGTAAAVTVTVGEVGRGLVQAYERPVIDKFTLALPGLQGLGNPLTILQVTDFHYGLFLGNAELERMVKLLNALEGDMVVVTGDLFHSPITPIGEAPDILKGLRDRRFGNLAVMGNHDFYAGEMRSVDAMRAGGLTLLRNSWMTLQEQGMRIHVGGIDDPMVNWMLGTKFPNFETFMAKAPREPGVRILLSHRPSVLPLAAAAGMDFVMAGHIHGGQVVFPWPGVERGLSLASIVSPFTHGWYADGRTRMYLNRGIGLTFIPWRINCPPEITAVHLGPGSGPHSSVSRTQTAAAASREQES